MSKCRRTRPRHGRLLRLFEQDKRPAVQRDLEEGMRLSVDAAPYFFIGTRRISGALTESQLRTIIDAELATMTETR